MSALHPDLPAALPRIAASFAQAQPFRHVVIDNFLDPALIERLLADFPTFEERYARNESGQVGGKAVRMDMPTISDSYAELDRAIQSPEFLQTISTITGIPDLLYDPDYVGGGTHENVHGQGLDPHVDFNILPGTGWHRRLNLIVYLNHEWEESWGGCLDLHQDPWSPEHDQIQTVLPLYNRCVVFETNEISWHGFRAIDLPPDQRGRSRKSLAIYLYTRERPPQETVPSHGTVYVPAGLPTSIRPGQVLNEGDWLELRKRFGRLKGQLKFLYQRELEHSRDYQVVVQALAEARAQVALPLEGYLHQVGVVAGYHPDGWASADVRFECQCSRSLSRLTLRLWAPPQLPAGTQVRVQAGAARAEATLTPGAVCEVVVDSPLSAGQRASVSIHTSATFNPSATGQPDDRELAWRPVAMVWE